MAQIAPISDIVVEQTTRHQRPKCSPFHLAIGMLQRAGYQVESGSNGGAPLLIVQDPVYASLPGHKHLVFSHNNTVILRDARGDSILQAASRFIEERS